MILSFSDSDEYIINKIKSAIGESDVEYTGMIAESVLSFANIEIYLKSSLGK